MEKIFNYLILHSTKMGRYLHMVITNVFKLITKTRSVNLTSGYTPVSPSSYIAFF